jgi:hypothetical protein
MSKSIERDIKDQYAKYFETEDWLVFKNTAEYYLETAAKTLKKDIKYGNKRLKLLHRNVQKRLSIGIACELLLKAFYLKNGYCINTLKDKKTPPGKFPYKIKNICIDDFRDDKTYTLAQLIDKMYDIADFGDEKNTIDKGLKIAKVFRNKEGHVVVLSHNYVYQNYRDIEVSLSAFYQIAFDQNLKIHFSVGDGEKAVFEIK